MLGRMMFALLGVPMMFSAILNVTDVFPYGQMNLIYNGNVIEITDEEKADIQSEFINYLENSHEMPAFGVIFPELYNQMIKDGYYLNFKFDCHFEINGLPFDELTIKINENDQGFNIYRGVDGVFQGRCFYINTENASTNLYNVIKSIVEKGNLNVDESDNGSLESDQINDNINQNESDNETETLN